MEGEAQACQQVVSGSAGHPEGQTDGPSHKDAGGGEPSTPACPHTRPAAAPLIKHKAPPRKDTKAWSWVKVETKDLFVYSMAPEVLALPPTGHTLTSRCRQWLTAEVQSRSVGLEAWMSCRNSLLVWEAAFVLGVKRLFIRLLKPSDTD